MIENRIKKPEFSKEVRQTFLDHFEFQEAVQMIREILDEIRTYL